MSDDSTSNSPQEDPAKTQDDNAGTDQPTPGSAANPAKNLEPEEVQRFITSIKNPVHQMGEHVLGALQHPNTMAVLTTIVVGPGGQQHIVSAALNPMQTAQVNQILQNAVQEREDEEVCVGFHCLIKPKKESEAEGSSESSK